MTTTQATKISEEALQELSSTEFACSSLKPLSGGSANFIFRGTLTHPLPDGTKEIAVKHGKGFVASNPDFQIPTTRCHAEVECLKALSGLPAMPGAYAVRAPKLYQFNPETNTQIQEYLPEAMSLKEYALKYFSSSRDPSRKPFCVDLGRSLGVWLRSFHNWAALPEQTDFRKEIRSNEAMQKIRQFANYSTLVNTVDNFPDILTDTRETFEKIRDATAEDINRPDLQVIHGDFWTGNALLPDRPLEAGAQIPVFIVDWEVCQFGLPALDLGQMTAEMYQLSLFKDIDEGKWLIEGLAAGYGRVDDDVAFRAALQVGTHLIAWGTRVAGWGSEAQVQQVVRVGKELILRAWHKDRAWFEAGDLACLFGSQCA